MFLALVFLINLTCVSATQVCEFTQCTCAGLSIVCEFGFTTVGMRRNGKPINFVFISDCMEKEELIDFFPHLKSINCLVSLFYVLVGM